MTTRQKFEERGINLNTLLILVSIAGGSIAIGKFAGPIFSTPERTAKVEDTVKAVERKVSILETGLSVQTESLKLLTAIASESNASSKKLERHDSELIELRRRLDRLEPR